MKVRWKVAIVYKSEHGLIDNEHLLEEISELDALVERGPHWDTIEEIKITRAGSRCFDHLTVEGAEKL